MDNDIDKIEQDIADGSAQCNILIQVILLSEGQACDYKECPAEVKIGDKGPAIDGCLRKEEVPKVLVPQ